jgi:hypothetical protein
MDFEQTKRILAAFDRRGVDYFLLVAQALRERFDLPEE